MSLVEALRARPTQEPPGPRTEPGPACRNCSWQMTRGPLAGECRKVAAVETIWAAVLGAPLPPDTDPETVAAWAAICARVEAEAEAAAAHRCGGAATCAAQQRRLGGVP